MHFSNESHFLLAEITDNQLQCRAPSYLLVCFFSISMGTHSATCISCIICVVLFSGYAYISNVAVSTAYRRSGVAARLMAEAESLAATWGCRTAGLHCNPKNTAAMQLYKQLKYKKAALEAPWMPYLQVQAGIYVTESLPCCVSSCWLFESHL